jgi:heat shock protein 5
VLVYDLGGGTFDVSLLSIDDNVRGMVSRLARLTSSFQVFEVLATAGDNHLGGEDFDNRVIEYFIELHLKNTGIDTSKDMRALGKLRREVENAKRVLSSQKSARLEIEAFAGGEDFSEVLTRAKFEELNADLFQKTLKSVENALLDAGLNKEQVNEVRTLCHMIS